MNSSCEILDLCFFDSKCQVYSCECVDDIYIHDMIYGHYKNCSMHWVVPLVALGIQIFGQLFAMYFLVPAIRSSRFRAQKIYMMFLVSVSFTTAAMVATVAEGGAFETTILCYSAAFTLFSVGTTELLKVALMVILGLKPVEMKRQMRNVSRVLVMSLVGFNTLILLIVIHARGDNPAMYNIFFHSMMVYSSGLMAISSVYIYVSLSKASGDLKQSSMSNSFLLLYFSNLKYVQKILILITLVNLTIGAVGFTLGSIPFFHVFVVCNFAFQWSTSKLVVLATKHGDRVTQASSNMSSRNSKVLRM